MSTADNPLHDTNNLLTEGGWHDVAAKFLPGRTLKQVENSLPIRKPGLRPASHGAEAPAGDAQPHRKAVLTHRTAKDSRRLANGVRPSSWYLNPATEQSDPSPHM